MNANTIKSTGSWVKRFKKWRRERQICHKLEEILKEKLDGTLQFFTEIRKNNGTNYEPDSLRTIDTLEKKDAH